MGRTVALLAICCLTLLKPASSDECYTLNERMPPKVGPSALGKEGLPVNPGSLIQVQGSGLETHQCFTWIYASLPDGGYLGWYDKAKLTESPCSQPGRCANAGQYCKQDLDCCQPGGSKHVACTSGKCEGSTSAVPTLAATNPSPGMGSQGTGHAGGADADLAAGPAGVVETRPVTGSEGTPSGGSGAAGGGGSSPPGSSGATSFEGILKGVMPQGAGGGSSSLG